jgi:Bacterial PH domain
MMHHNIPFAVYGGDGTGNNAFPLYSYLISTTPTLQNQNSGFMNSYPTTLDTVSKIISGFMVCLVGYLVIQSIQLLVGGKQGPAPLFTVGIVAALLLATTLYCYYTMPRAIATDPEKLTIETKAKQVRIFYGDIRTIRKADDGEMSGVVRTFGNGGCFGYTGLYYNKALGSMRWYCTQRKNYIIIEKTDAKRLVVTCDDPDALLGDTYLAAGLAK